MGRSWVPCGRRLGVTLVEHWRLTGGLSEGAEPARSSFLAFCDHKLRLCHQVRASWVARGCLAGAVWAPHWWNTGGSGKPLLPPLSSFLAL